MTRSDHVVEGSPDVAGPVRSLVPGLSVVAVGTAAAFFLNTLVPAVSALTVAVVLGVAVGGRLPAGAREGLGWATKKFLRLGVVLLGLQLGLGEVFGLGAGKVLAVVVTVLVAFFGTLLLGRLIRVSRGLALMVATGFSICGASAIAAMDSVTESDKEDVATAVTLVTLYGSAAIALIPFVGQALGMSPERLGSWAGLSVHEVAQVVAAASPAGAGAGGGGAGGARAPGSGGARRLGGAGGGSQWLSNSPRGGCAGGRAGGGGTPSSGAGEARPPRGSVRRSFRCSSSGSWR
ncbi:YeiH family protein [Streptomyces hygroscopicus]|uniref:YeiH family protein n=1 Tax=Streptomyces hygroscopicus TaxID=1912 RepID=UPI0036CB9663